MRTIYFLDTTTLAVCSKFRDVSITDYELNLEFGEGFWFDTYDDAEHEADALKYALDI